MKQPKTKPGTSPAESKPVGIVAFEGKEFFGVGTATVNSKLLVRKVVNYNPPIHSNGQLWPWAVEVAEYTEDSKQLLRIVGIYHFKTKPEADFVAKNFRQLDITNAETGQIIQKRKATQPAANGPKLSSNEQDLRNARLKVLRETYPDTFKAMDAHAQAKPEARPAAVEALFRAYALDLARLFKPAKLGDILPFKTWPDDSNFILELAKAYAQKSPFDAVDNEIAARWYAAGYDKMKPDEYTAAINTKTGATLKPGAMKKRRLKKLRLLSSNPEGAPIREI
jgi:hypothetical protein